MMTRDLIAIAIGGLLGAIAAHLMNRQPPDDPATNRYCSCGRALTHDDAGLCWRCLLNKQTPRTPPT